MEFPYDFIIGILKVISGSVLIIYPVMFIANIMSIAGFKNKNTSRKRSFRETIFRFFIYYNTAYPITYGLCYWMCDTFAEQGNYAWAIGIISLPVLILAALFKYSTK
ncbi:hypothetical protein [Cytophaga hutchinsonii]|uniref:Uncharacterized protein n=1 Tax=Cytophaga hutchinsonii (strain ATCC 33406 / DSM 1761 / CIP 103989 / NBRC 15051 / NCIMB 9469 / D465) TaxID=269798 RepID=A0A6N4SN22_CYTH3|nr:hypothetical protein [Cytophaga hutchinsonii]ABG57691.1 hypothetical protein CHU_0401 [Cytophaga hutchinsonii ATCC 33406]SFX03070.1 hypothetical protein SAMN04487930_101251 [Cytophaga hutchinsonii ATCC 33406]